MYQPLWYIQLLPQPIVPSSFVQFNSQKKSFGCKCKQVHCRKGIEYTNPYGTFNCYPSPLFPSTFVQWNSQKKSFGCKCEQAHSRQGIECTNPYGTFQLLPQPIVLSTFVQLNLSLQDLKWKKEFDGLM
jgi:hypothetical protein